MIVFYLSRQQETLRQMFLDPFHKKYLLLKFFRVPPLPLKNFELRDWFSHEFFR